MRTKTSRKLDGPVAPQVGTIGYQAPVPGEEVTLAGYPDASFQVVGYRRERGYQVQRARGRASVAFWVSPYALLADWRDARGEPWRR